MDSEFAPFSLPCRAVPGELVLRRRLVVRLGTFVIMETAFIALAIACLSNPLPCSLSSSPTLTKASFTILFIAWQTVAIMCAQDVVSHGFSSEWHFRFHKTGNLSPGHTDLVSTITSGLHDRIHYFFVRTSSVPYRLSFIAFWILVALAGIAPGSMTVDDVPRFIQTAVGITNFTLTGGDTNTILFNPIIRASLVSELELRENSPFKFTTEDHVVAGWPNVEPGQLMGDTEFESDVLFYGMKCWWEAPSFNSSRWNTTWYAGGYAWYPWTTPLPSTTFDGGMMPMFRFPTEQEFTPHDFPDPLPAVDPVGLSGYLFFGRNSSFPQIPSVRRNFNLEGLPTTFNDLGFHFVDFENSDGYFKSPLATFLLCDPQARILDGLVLLSQANSSITVLSTSPPIGSNPRAGNIPVDAANVLLGLGQLETLECDDETAAMRIGALASRVFLNDTSLNFDTDLSNPFDVGILSTEDIQRNLDFFMKSGAKAFSSYIRDYNVENSDKLFLMPVQGATQRNELALVASHGLLVSTICLFFSATILIVVNLFYLNIWQTPPFKLEVLIDCIAKYLQESEKSIPIPHPASDSAQTQLRKLLAQLFGFIVIEAVFLSLVLVCSMKPITIIIPLPSAEMKGGFTVLFILWQALAIFLLSGATALAFSSEWSFQHAKTGRLIPGVTDRVSRLSSGNDDRSRFFFTRMPSATFRVAFLLSLLLIVLGSFAPGTLSVSGVKTGVEMPLNIADLQFLNSSQTDENDNNLDSLSSRADILTTMEQVEDSIFKYDVEPNWVTAWPDEKSIEPSVVGNMEYPTDIVHFNYSCSWRIPTMGTRDGATTWIVDGQSWEPWDDPLPDFLYRGGILPLYRDVDVQPDGLSAYLFIGTNDSFPVDRNETKRSIISLNNLPTLLHPSGLQINTSDSESESEFDTSQWISPLSTLLLCDPHIESSGGRVQLSMSKKLTVTASGLPPVGNMPPDVINTIFAYATLVALGTGDETEVTWVGSLSVRVFLTDISKNFTGFPQGVPVHDLSIVNDNLNKFTLSASKAFSDGFYVSPTNQSYITAQTRLVVGLKEVEKPALVGDKTLGLVSLCLSIGAAVGFGILVHLLNANPGATFELENIMQALQERE